MNKTARVIATMALVAFAGTGCGSETVSSEECIELWNDELSANEYELFPDDARAYVTPQGEQDRLGYATCYIDWFTNEGMCLSGYFKTTPSDFRFQPVTCQLLAEIDGQNESRDDDQPLNNSQTIQATVAIDGSGQLSIS